MLITSKGRGYTLKNSNSDTGRETEKIICTKEVQESFRKILKQGIYKELHKRSLLSDAQLNSLINEK